jgi:hypothetical protein
MCVFSTSETHLGLFQATVQSPVHPELDRAPGPDCTGTGDPGMPFLLLRPFENFFSFIGVSPFSCLGRQGISPGDTPFLSQPQFSTRNVTAQDYPGQLSEIPTLGFPYGGLRNNRFHWYLAYTWRPSPRRPPDVQGPRHSKTRPLWGRWLVSGCAL